MSTTLGPLSASGPRIQPDTFVFPVTFHLDLHH
jgi:hypothetical protein